MNTILLPDPDGPSAQVSTKAGELQLTIDQHKNIGGYRGDGTVVCRHHGTFITFKGSEFGKRDGL